MANITVSSDVDEILKKSTKAEIRSALGLEKQTTLTNDDSLIPTSGAVVDYVDSKTTPVTVFTGTLGETYSRYKPEGWLKQDLQLITFAIESVKLGSEVPSITNIWMKSNENQYDDLKMVDLGNIETIPLEAFKKCSGLKQVIIRDSVYVNEMAFAHCTSLTNLDLGRVKYTQDAVFFGCTSLETVTIPDSMVFNSSFGTETFKDCTALATINCYAPYSAFGSNDSDRLLNTSSNLTIHAKPNTGWTAGTNLSIQGNASVDVILDLV